MAAAPPPPTTNLGRAAAHPCSGVRRAFSCQPPPTWRVGSGTHLSGAVCVGPPRSDRTGRAGARSVSTHALGLHPQGQSCVCRIHVRDRKTATAPQHPVTNGVVRSARTCHGEFWMFPFGYARPTDANLEATTANCHNRHHGRPGQGTAVEAPAGQQYSQTAPRQSPPRAQHLTASEAPAAAVVCTPEPVTPAKLAGRRGRRGLLALS